MGCFNSWAKSILKGGAAGVLLPGLLIVAMAACGSGEPPPASTASPTATTEIPTPTAEPTPTDAGDSRTPTPNPVGTPSTLPPMDVEQGARFDGDPEGAAPFMAILSRIPVNDETRWGIVMKNPLALYEDLNLEPPALSDGEEAWAEFVSSLTGRSRGSGDQANLEALPVFWPDHLSRGAGRFEPLSQLGWDGRSVDAYASAGGQTVGNMAAQHEGSYEVALGEFDPQRTEAALESCEECHEPEIRERSGISYYHFNGEGRRGRHDPPLYDHIGRGGDLLVREGEAYYSWEEGVIPDFIDFLNDEGAPSLAGEGDYPLVAEKLAAGGADHSMGITTHSMYLDGEGEDAVIRGTSLDQSVHMLDEHEMRAVRKGPLLKPFSTAGSGVGMDDEGAWFRVIVLAHEHEAEASENAELFAGRLQQGAYAGGMANGEDQDTPFSEEIERVEIQADGRVMTARLYPRPDGSDLQVHPWDRVSNGRVLLLHESPESD